MQHIHNRKISNPVVISGDIHSFFANDLKLDFDDQASPVVATEFVGSSISSYGPPYDPIAKVLPDNPHVHFFDSRRRGYVVVDLTADAMQVQLRVVSDGGRKRTLPNTMFMALRHASHKVRLDRQPKCCIL